MNTGLNQRQTHEQRQIQTTSAVQVMLSKMMEMPLADFEQHVINEIEDNAALEIDNDDTLWDNTHHNDTPQPNDEIGIRDSHTTQDDYNDYLTIDQVPEDMRERYNQELKSAGATRQYDGDTERQIADNGTTSYDDIIAQIGELDLTPDEETAMQYLIGSLDERGYLTKDNLTLIDELTFQEYIYLDEPQLQRLINLLQTFEPRGIGAHNLQECLLLQMKCDPSEKTRIPLVKRLTHKVIRDMFDELSHSRWDKIQNTLDIDDQTIKEIQHTIHHLNPHPGAGLNESQQSAAPTVIPDFYVYTDELGTLNIIQERGQLPELRVSDSFIDIINTHKQALDKAHDEGHTPTFTRAQEDAYNYASHKVETARAFIESIRRRQHTLQRVMEGIVKKQHDFFTSDDDETLLKPMVLRDIADYAAIDISTVSRAVNSKYVHTNYGTYPLKYFFSSEFVNSEGDNISQRHAQNAIRRLIESEDHKHPYSDQKLTEMLADEGLVVARRTVAKYRERLGYPTSSLRRR